ncbi:hypothetical protein BH10PSE13_BH10PSE13_08240 [soil metagenome]
MAAMLASAATPVMAQRGWNGGRGWDRGRHDHVDGLGAFVGIAALFGAVAIIASSANKDKRAAETRNAPPPPPDYRYDGETGSAGPAPTGTEEAAVDDCALAARDEGSQDGGYAEVRDITNTRAWQGGWAVDGTIDQRQGYRGQGVTRRFSCTWRDGKVADVVLSRDTIALADTPSQP